MENQELADFVSMCIGHGILDSDDIQTSADCILYKQRLLSDEIARHLVFGVVIQRLNDIGVTVSERWEDEGDHHILLWFWHDDDEWEYIVDGSEGPHGSMIEEKLGYLIQAVKRLLEDIRIEDGKVSLIPEEEEEEEDEY